MMYSLTGRAVRLATAAALLSISALPALAANDAASADTQTTCTATSPSKLALSKMTVGFSQSENEQNPFRAAETASIRAAAKKAGIKRLLYANANSDQAKQVADIQSLVNQGVDALIVAPLNSTGLKPAFAAARAKHIPVVIIDRHTAGTFCQDYITFMGSDFRQQAVRAGQALAKAVDGKAHIAELQGAYGNSVETARTEGFAEVVNQHPNLSIAAKQSANWSTTNAQKVMAQILLSHPNVNAVYSQADTMTLGALTAIRQYGKQAGKDIKLVSIDGTDAILKEVAAGRVAADIETNPRFGPRAFQALEDYAQGKAVDQKIIMQDKLYTKDNAQQALDSDS